MQVANMYYVVTKTLADAMLNGARRQPKGKVYGVFNSADKADAFIELNKLQLSAKVVRL
jgi:hypothetical protein